MNLKKDTVHKRQNIQGARHVQKGHCYYFTVNHHVSVNIRVGKKGDHGAQAPTFQN